MLRILRDFWKANKIRLSKRLGLTVLGVVLIGLPGVFLKHSLIVEGDYDRLLSLIGYIVIDSIILIIIGVMLFTITFAFEAYSRFWIAAKSANVPFVEFCRSSEYKRRADDVMRIKDSKIRFP